MYSAKHTKYTQNIDKAITWKRMTSCSLASSMVQSRAAAEQGLEDGEAEENRGGSSEHVEDLDLDLGWMGVCCTALDVHAADPHVQVGRSNAIFENEWNLKKPNDSLQEAACWAIHSLLVHGTGRRHPEEEQDDRYSSSILHTRHGPVFFFFFF